MVSTSSTTNARGHRSTRHLLALAATIVTIAALTASAGCDGSSMETPASGSGTRPLYALMTQVYSEEDRTVYVSLSDTLDVGEVKLEQAREFPGVANLAAVGGKLLISHGDRPVISQFEISDGFAWTERASVSFMNYALLDNANFYYQFFADDHTALLPFEGTKRIAWDPTNMTIKSVLADASPTLVDEEGLTLEAGGNRNSVRYDSNILQAFFFHDDDWFRYGTHSYVVAYDAETHAEAKVIDIPCPGISLATRDERGNTYFGTWDLPLSSVRGLDPAPCVVRIAATLNVDQQWDLRQWTSGRFVNNFRYVGNGKAVANVLHHEVFGVASAAEIPTEQADELWRSGPHWQLWLFDVEAHTGRPIEGIDVPVGSGLQFAVLDGRTFLFVPYDDWKRTRAYELDASGTATARFDTSGDVFKWVRVR